MSENGTETTALVLPERPVLQRELQAVRAFQQLAQSELIRGHDFGVIPGTQKPTLLKPGAKKIAKLLKLADTYEILHEIEDFERPFFAYTVRCRLKPFGTDFAVSEGLGECNSYESKYRYRWLWASDASEEVKRTAVTRTINTKRGRTTQYRVDNDDIFSQVNTLLKMAKKRALVDAALSAGRLSDVFTQDLEEMAADDTVIEGEAREVAPDAPGRAEPSAAHQPDAQDDPGPRRPSNAQMERYGKGLQRAAELGIKTEPYVPPSSVTLNELEALAKGLKTAIEAAERKQDAAQTDADFAADTDADPATVASAEALATYTDSFLHAMALGLPETEWELAGQVTARVLADAQARIDEAIATAEEARLAEAPA